MVTDGRGDLLDLRCGKTGIFQIGNCQFGTLFAMDAMTAVFGVQCDVVQPGSGHTQRTVQVLSLIHILAAVILLADLGHDLQRILLTVLLCFDGISNLATLFYERIALKNYYRGAKVEVEVVDGERIEHRK